jgi:hypothetical protein
MFLNFGWCDCIGKDKKNGSMTNVIGENIQMDGI